ncbi:hypothetical protein D3C79_996800 [compost metagenome]
MLPRPPPIQLSTWSGRVWGKPKIMYNTGNNVSPNTMNHHAKVRNSEMMPTLPEEVTTAPRMAKKPWAM